MTKYSLVYFLPTIIMFISFIITVYLVMKDYISLRFLYLSLIDVVVLSVLSFSFPYLFLWWNISGYVFYTLSVLTVLSFLILNIYHILGFSKSISFIEVEDEDFLLVSFILTSACFLSILILLPFVVFPNINNKELVSKDSNKSLDVKFVGKGFENIRNSFEQVQKSIFIETSAIDKAIADFKQDLKSQEQRLGQLQVDLKTKQAEVERYKALANLTKEQREAVAKEIDRGKPIDYIVGFVLGIIGSLLVEHFPKLFQQLKE